MLLYHGSNEIVEYPTHQISFHTISALDTLTFLESEVVYGKKNNNAFFTCSLIEYIGRYVKRKRTEVADGLGIEKIQRVYDYADVFHCEPIEKVAVELIEDCYEEENILGGIWAVYHSWIDAHISDYNTDFYYHPRDYIAACYKENKVL